jgi:hypothetical protein
MQTKSNPGKEVQVKRKTRLVKFKQKLRSLGLHSRGILSNKLRSLGLHSRGILFNTVL